MRKSTIQLSLLVPVVFSIAACAAKPTVTAVGSPAPNLPTAVNPTVEEPNTALPEATLASDPTASAIAPSPVGPSWTTYIFTSGVSVDYPADWTIIPYPYDFVDFRSAAEGTSTFNVRLEVYNRPLQDRAMANPHSWENNEGGYAVHWEKPIAIEGAEGLEFVWGVTRDNQWEMPPQLMAVYYNEQSALDVRLTTAFDNQSMVLAQTQGLTNTIAANFSIFEHMVQSVRFSP